MLGIFHMDLWTIVRRFYGLANLGKQKKKKIAKEFNTDLNSGPQGWESSMLPLDQLAFDEIIEQCVHFIDLY